MSVSNPPTDSTLHLLRNATDCAKRGEFEQARTHLTALLNIEPRHELATGMLAAVYAELKEPQQAAEHFERVLQIEPGNPLARFQLGLIRLELQEPQAALDSFEYGLSRGAYGPNEFLARFYSGVALLQLDRSDDARAALQQAQQFIPIDHVLYPRLLELLIKLDN